MYQEMPPCATNVCPGYSGRNTTQRSGFPFCCLSRRLQMLQLLLFCVTSSHALCSLVQPGFEESTNLVHLFSNRSNQEQGYCGTEARLASSLDFWTLSSENHIAVLPVDPVKENYVRKVKNCIFSIAFPTPFKSRIHLVAVSKEVLEDILDLDLSVSETDVFIQLVSGEKIVFGSIPLTHRYGGHQFGVWTDQLGDGRAHFIGIYRNRQGEKWELQLKGSGKTPYSWIFFALWYLRQHTLLPCGCLLVLLMILYQTSDDERIYKIGNQASIGMFNLNKLLHALNPLLNPGQKQLAAQILEGYPVLYYTRFTELFKAKLGLLGEKKGDDDLIAFLLHLMEKTEADFTVTFRQLREITQSQLQELNIPQQFWALRMISKHQLFPAWVSQYLLRLKSNMNDSDSERRRMTTVNPRYVLKNWMAESAVQKAKE